VDTITIHLHSGTKIVANIVQEDLAAEGERVAHLNDIHNGTWDDEIDSSEGLVESALTVPPKPRWVWIGDAFVFTQAVAGVEYGGDQ
jgi:hypothetical protein